MEMLLCKQQPGIEFYNFHVEFSSFKQYDLPVSSSKVSKPLSDYIYPRPQRTESPFKVGN
jgi:hypothetical protein